MVSKSRINDIIEKSIVTVVKCSPSAKARSIGASVQESTYTNSNGEKVIRYDYGNGVHIDLVEKHLKYNVGDEYNPVYFEGGVWSYDNVTYDGKEYPVLSASTSVDGDADTFFQHQKQQIIEEYGEDGWDFYCKYSNEFGTYQGWNLNSVLRGERSIDEVTDEDGGFYISSFLLDNHDRFVEMEKSLPLDQEDFVSIRLMTKLHSNDSISKKIVSDKGHTCTSIVGDMESYDTYGDPYNNWFVFTLNDKGSGVCGGYLGSAIKEEDGFDFEREVNYVPEQKFERLVIDEENKFIIQKPVIENNINSRR